MLIESTSGSGELSTADVAAYLGVKPQTVYAYVSRGLLTPSRKHPHDGSFFPLSQVQRLAVRGRRKPRATSDDVRTSVTQVTTASLAYRGRAIDDVVRELTYAQTWGLLTGVPDSTPKALTPDERRTLRTLLDALPDGGSPLDRLKHAVLVAGATDPGRADRRPEALAAAGRRAALFMAQSLAPTRRSGSVADLVGHAIGPCPPDLLDTAMVLLADHDQAISTTAVRVAVSSGTDLYSAFLAGLAAADSPQHATHSTRVGDWLPGAVADPLLVLTEALAADSPPPGFGHVVYTDVDPRAVILLDRLRAHDGVPEQIAWLQDELATRRGWMANVDLALALLVRRFALVRPAGALIFTCARTAGWTAHAIEEAGERPLRFRLRGVYTRP